MPRRIAVLALIVTLAGCGSSGTTSSAHPDRTMQIVGTEMAFRGPTQTDAGTYAVTFRNDGMVWHEVAFKASSGRIVARRSVAPKQAVTFPVSLLPGMYELGCYEPGHYEQGMHQPLAVT